MAAVIVDDMPGGLQEDKDLHLPKGWVQVVYGIPETSSGLRDRLRKIVKGYGLISIDLGGSVYMGVRKLELDNALGNIVKKIERETGMKDLVRLIPGDYDELEAAFFKDRVTGNLLSDAQEAEQAIAELEKALAGEITLVDKENKPRDLLSLGESRLRSAKKVLESADAVTARFAGIEALEQESERIRLRMTQIRTWVESVDKGYKRWAEIERARRRKN